MKSLLRYSLGLSSLIFLIGCQDNIDHQQIRQSGFVYCGQGAPTTFNPQLVDGGITSEALSPQLYNTLLTIEPDSQRLVPSLASRWYVTHQGTAYTFVLRDDVTFHTTRWFTPSRRLNAHDVVFSFQRIIDPQHPFHEINSSSYPWFNSLNIPQNINKIEALDDYTVRFTLNAADNTFLANISTAHAVILSAEYANQLQVTGQLANLDTHPVGTGPFYLDEYQPLDLIRLRRHATYWQGSAKMQQVVFDISQRGTGTLAKLLRNECDVLTTPLASQLPVITEHPELILSSKPAMNIAFIAVNTQRPALSDVRVRSALNFAINRQNILDSIYYGTGTIAYNLLPPDSWAYQANQSQIRYDRNYALALLAEAGWSHGLELTMSVPNDPKIYNPSPRKTAELIQTQLADIGVTLHLLSEDRLTQRQFSQRADVDLFLTGWVGKTADPDNFLRPLLSCNANQLGLNVAMWCNNEFDFLLDLAREVDRPRYRLNLYTQAQNLLNQQLPVIPLAHGKQFKAYHQSLSGFELSPFHVQPFHNIERVSE